MLNELSQYGDISFLLLRLVIAAIFIYHAMPKLKNSKMMADSMGTKKEMVLSLGIVEFASSLGMVFGVYIKVASLLLAIVMIGAIYMKAVKWSVPFSAMNKTGWEFDLILLAANIFILANGGGAMVVSSF